jgi:hypothetical protein
MVNEVSPQLLEKLFAIETLARLPIIPLIGGRVRPLFGKLREIFLGVVFEPFLFHIIFTYITSCFTVNVNPAVIPALLATAMTVERVIVSTTVAYSLIVDEIERVSMAVR